MKTILALLLVLCLGSSNQVLLSQSYKVEGVVHDVEGNTLAGASAVVLQKSDSVMVAFGISNKEGLFSLRRVPVGDYLLQITFVGFEGHISELSIVSNDIMLPPITMEESTLILDELVVSADHIPMTVSGDTLEFNADAFGMPKNSSVEQLLRRLPGVEVERDGSIKAQGEDVKKVLVDGKEFFGNDPSIATRNLPSEAVDKVQVFDKASEMAEFTGIEDGDDEKTINLKLKDDHKNGRFGYLQTGGGRSEYDARYKSRASINHFSPQTQASFIGNLNNVNEQGFSISESINFGGGFSSGGNMQLAGGVPNGGDEDGFTSTRAGGINFNRDFSANTSLRSSYFQSGVETQKVGVFSQNTLAGLGLSSSTEGSLANRKDNTSHKFDYRLLHKLSPASDFQIKGSFNLRNSADDNNTISVTTRDDGQEVNSSDRSLLSEGRNYGLNAKSIYRLRFSKPGRNLVLDGQVELSDSDVDDSVDALNSFAETEGSVSERLLQQQLGSSMILTDRQKISYTEPFGGSVYGELHFERRGLNDDQDRRFIDGLGGAFIDSLGSSSTRSYSFLTSGMNLRWVGESNLTLGIDFQYSDLSGEILNRGESVKSNFKNWLPKLDFSKRIGQDSNLRFSYSTSTREPSLRELQPFVDNRNPISIFSGNPDLEPEYRHSANINFTWFDTFSFTNLFSYAYLLHFRNRITMARIIDDQLRQSVTPVNSGSSNVAGFNINYGTPIRSLGIKMALRNASSIQSGLELINGEENKSQNIRNELSLRLQNRNKDLVDMSIAGKATFYGNRYSLNEDLERSYWNRSIEAELLLLAGADWKFESLLDYRFIGDELFTGKSSIPILDFGIYRSVYDGRGELSLVLKDALNQNEGVSYLNQSNYIQESRINSLGRYALFSLRFNLSNVGRQNNIIELEM